MRQAGRSERQNAADCRLRAFILAMEGIKKVLRASLHSVNTVKFAERVLLQ